MKGMTENCFKKCTGTNGNGLDLREKTCLNNCSERYMEAMNVVSVAIRNRGGH